MGGVGVEVGGHHSAAAAAVVGGFDVWPVGFYLFIYSFFKVVFLLFGQGEGKRLSMGRSHILCYWL